MIEIFFLIKTGKRTKFYKTEFYGEESLMCEINPRRIKYGKILRKAKKYSPDLILITEEAAEYTDFTMLEKYTCYTPKKLIYDNFDKISDKYFKLYGCGMEKITLGIAAKDISFLKQMENLGDRLKCIYVFGNMAESEEAENFFRNTGVNVILRSVSQNISCDLYAKLSDVEIYIPFGKPVADFSDFKDFERECKEIGKILVKYLLNLLKNT